jgi:phospholipase C
MNHEDLDYMLPFPLSFDKTAATCMKAPLMAYDFDIKMWNSGRMNAWNTARPAGYGMSSFNRSDLPFYYSLADAFTIGDQYF